MDDYHAQPLAHPSIGKYCLMPLKDMKFGSKDICLHQIHHTIAYARALQHWTEEAQHPVAGQPHHLVGSVLELCQAMDPLITFGKGDVFITMALSRWMEITLPQLMMAASPGPSESHTCSTRAHPRGSLSATHNEGWPTPTTMQATAEAEVPTAPPWEFMLLESTSDHKHPCPMPRFMEIALWGRNPWIVASHQSSLASCLRRQ